MKITMYVLETNSVTNETNIKEIGYLKHVKRKQVYSSQKVGSNYKDYFDPIKCLDILFGTYEDRKRHLRLFDTPSDLKNYKIIFYNPDDYSFYHIIDADANVWSKILFNQKI